MKDLCEEKITSMLEEYVSREKFGEVLELMSRFPQLGFENVLLLLCQYPTATVICGKGAWNNYHATVKEGKKTIALLAPVFTMTEYEEESGQGDDFLDDSVCYGVLPVYDISQVDVTEYTPDFRGKQKLPENRIEKVLKEQWQVTVIEDITTEYVGSNRMIKSKFMEEEKVIYLRTGLSRQVREAELLKHYARLQVNDAGITAYAMELEHYLKLVVGTYFELPGIDLSIRGTDLFAASQEEMREVLQQLSFMVFRMISELLGERQLDFIQTIFCNLFFEPEDMSEAMSKVGEACEMADSVDLHKELLRFLNRMQQLSKEEYQYIWKRRMEQTLFTFPSVVLPERV